MKTSKKLLVLILVLTMIISVVVPTFSWYDTSSQSGTGLGAEYSQTHYAGVYNASLTTTTYKGTMSNGEVTYSDEVANDLGGALDVNGTAYYKTVVDNLSEEQSAKFNFILDEVQFGNTLNSNTGDIGDMCFGSISPIYNKQTFSKNYIAHKTSYDKIRIYFQPKGYWETKTTNNFYVYHYVSEADRTEVKMTFCGNSTDYGSDGQPLLAWYADIPYNSTGFYITNTPKEDAGGDQRIKTIENLDSYSQLSEMVVYLKEGTSSDDYGNRNYGIYTRADQHVKVANVKNYYDSITAQVGATGAKIPLTIDEDYTGKNISYSSSDSNVVTVNSSTGELTFVGDGSATITTTISSVYTDKLLIKTNVEVSSPKKQIPIVEGVEVNANRSVEICWFIKNNTQETQFYNITGVSVTQ